MMPLHSRVAGMSMGLPMADPPPMYMSDELTFNLPLALPWPLVVRCPVAFLMSVWSTSTCTTLSVALSSERPREEVVISKKSSYQMLRWKTFKQPLVQRAKLAPTQMIILTPMRSRSWITSPCRMWLAQT